MTTHRQVHVGSRTWPETPGAGGLPPGTPPAVIEVRPRSPNTSARTKAQPWLLTFQPRGPAPARNFLTGHTEGTDPFQHVELRFTSRDAAIAFAERHGLEYDVYRSAPVRSGASGTIDLDAALINPAGVFESPRDVLDCPLLSRAQKHEILKRWEWDARLIETAATEAMPDKGEPSRLEEVMEALIRLGVEPPPEPGPLPALAMPVPPIPANDPVPAIGRIAA